MTLAKKILEIRKQSDARHIADQVILQVFDIAEFMDIFFSEEWRMCQKASWPMGMIADKKPELLYPYLSQMLDLLDHAKHDAIIRNTIRTWQIMNIPEELEGPIYDRCFEYFADPQYAVAIRVFAMTVCTNIAMRHPSLAHEIIPIIEDYWDHSKPAWRSRGKQELKRLAKVVN